MLAFASVFYCRRAQLSLQSAVITYEQVYFGKERSVGFQMPHDEPQINEPVSVFSDETKCCSLSFVPHYGQLLNI